MEKRAKEKHISDAGGAADTLIISVISTVQHVDTADPNVCVNITGERHTIADTGYSIGDIGRFLVLRSSSRVSELGYSL